MEGFIGSCDCPYFQDRFHVCKHIWAAVLAADSRGLLPPADSQSWIEPVDVPAERDDVVTGDSASSAAGVPRPESWELFLEDVARQLDATDAMRPAARYANTQLLYVLDRDSTLGGNGIAIQVVGRQRKKSGEWGKPQPAPISADEIERLPDAADREISALLLGAAEAPAYGHYVCSSNFTRASFRLTGPLVDKVLPMIAPVRTVASSHRRR